MSLELVEWIKSGSILVADGATGTQLQAAGLPGGTIPEQWSISQPDKIKALHLSYLDVGARIIVSNTFGANRIKLNRANHAELVADANLRGAEIAREAAAPYKAFVGGDMGPTGELLEPLGTLTFEKAVETYAEQAQYLAKAGVDCLWIETMSDLAETRAAIEGIQQATSLPILCSLSFDTHGRTMMGVKPTQAAEQLKAYNLVAIGGNCGASLDDMADAVKGMAEILPNYPLIAKPNAGLPQLIDGKSVYNTTPQEMAQYAVRFVELGARIVGGCCGSTPAHIAAIADAVSNLQF